MTVDLSAKTEVARWHISRYDALRASLASRASFLISADAVLVAGVAALVPRTIGADIPGGALTVAVLAVAGIGVLIAAVASMLSATSALLSSRSWRELYGTHPPSSMFYQHSDTIRDAPSFPAFHQAFTEQSVKQDYDAAVVNLWVVLRTHHHRYRFLRRAARQLQTGIAVFASAVVLVIVLTLAETLAR